MRKVRRFLAVTLAFMMMATSTNTLALAGATNTATVAQNVNGAQGTVVYSTDITEDMAGGSFSLTVSAFEGMQQVNLAVRIDGTVQNYWMSQSAGASVSFNVPANASTLEVIASSAQGEPATFTFVIAEADAAAYTVATQEAPAGGFVPGTYTATASGGFGGDITVEVTVDETSILEIEVVDHNETPFFASMAFDVIPSIIDAQSTNVDTIATATMTSCTIINAVNSALAQATQEGADETAEVEEVAQAGDFIPGTYTATVVGGWDFITLSVEVSATEVLNVSISHNETEMFTTAAVATLEAALMEAQSANIDVVAGATVTSNAIIEAASLAFAQANGEIPVIEDTPFIAGRYTGLARPDMGSTGEGNTRVWLTFDEYSIVDVEIMYHANTGEEFDQEATNEIIIANILENQSTDGIVIEDAPYATENILLAVNLAIENATRRPTFVVVEGAPSGEGSFSTGVFVTEIQGRNAPIIVGIGTTNSAVMRAVVAHRETPVFADRVIEQLVQDIIAYQTNEIDVMAGATTSTNAILEAFAYVFSQAMQS
jgi:uncharacterized protein with FMN-binding domain